MISRTTDEYNLCPHNSMSSSFIVLIIHSHNQMSSYSIFIVHCPRYSNSYSSNVLIMFCYLASIVIIITTNSRYRHSPNLQLFSSSMFLFFHGHHCHPVFISLCSQHQLFSSFYVLIILLSSSTVLVIIHCYLHPLSSSSSIKRYILT